MAAFNIGDEVEVVSTGESSTIEAVTKNIFRQERYKIVGNSTKFKESELRRATQSSYTTSSIIDPGTSPDLVTQVVLANVYMDQMDDIVQDVTEQNNAIEEIQTTIESIPEVVTEKASFVEERETRWEAPVSTESKSVDVDTSSSRSSSVDDSTSSWRSSSSDDSSSSWRSSSSDDSSSSSRWSSSSDDSSSSWSSSSSDSSSYDSGSSSSSSSDW